MMKTAMVEILLQMEDNVRVFNEERGLNARRSRFFSSVWLVDEKGQLLPCSGNEETRLTSRLKFPVDYRMIIGREVSYGHGYKIQTHIETYSSVGYATYGKEQRLCFIRVGEGVVWENQNNLWISDLIPVAPSYPIIGSV